MKFVERLMQGLTFLPYIIQGVEAIVGKGSGQGTPKRDKALQLFNLAAGVTEAIAQKDIIDQAAFTEATIELNNAIVKMLNASVWHKSKTETPAA